MKTLRCRRVKALFEASRDSLSSRKLGKKLRKEGFNIARHRVIRLMKCLGLVVAQRIAYEVTTKCKCSLQHSVVKMKD